MRPNCVRHLQNSNRLRKVRFFLVSPCLVKSVSTKCRADLMTFGSNVIAPLMYLHFNSASIPGISRSWTESVVVVVLDGLVEPVVVVLKSVVVVLDSIVVAESAVVVLESVVVVLEPIVVVIVESVVVVESIVVVEPIVVVEAVVVVELPSLSRSQCQGTSGKRDSPKNLVKKLQSD